MTGVNKLLLSAPRLPCKPTVQPSWLCAAPEAWWKVPLPRRPCLLPGVLELGREVERVCASHPFWVVQQNLLNKSPPLLTMFFTRLSVSVSILVYSRVLLPRKVKHASLLRARGLPQPCFQAVYSCVLYAGTDTKNKLPAVDGCSCPGGGWVALLGHNVLLSWPFGDSAGRVTGVMNLMVSL